MLWVHVPTRRWLAGLSESFALPSEAAASLSQLVAKCQQIQIARSTSAASSVLFPSALAQMTGHATDPPRVLLSLFICVMAVPRNIPAVDQRPFMPCTTAEQVVP